MPEVAASTHRPKRLPEPTLRPGALTWEVRVRIPPEARGDKFKGSHTSRSLGTRDKADAYRKLVKVYDQLLTEFEAEAAKLAGPTKALTSLAHADRARLAEQHYVALLEDEPLRRRKLLAQAREDEAAFWRGEIVPIPADWDGAHSYWNDVCCDGETPLDDAFHYAITSNQKARKNTLRRQLDIGDCDAFLPLARKLAPLASETDHEKLALDLMGAEIRALKDMALHEDVQLQDAWRNREAPQQLVSSPATTDGLVANPKQNPLMSAVIDDWIASKTGKALRGKTKEAQREAVKLFIEIIGDKPIASVAKDDMREFKAILQKLPKNRRKRVETRALKAREAADVTTRLGLPTMHAKTINERLSILYNLFSWLQRHYDAVRQNPFDGALIEVNSDPRKEKDAFTTDDIQAIFSDSRFTESKRDNADFWIPILALYTGARANEICKLKIADIKIEENIDFIDINAEPFSDSKISAKLKTRHCQRRIPIHRDVIELGFVGFVSAMRRRGIERLFPELQPDRDGKLHDGFCDKFRRWLKKIGVKRPKIDFHSFRHSWTDAAVNAKVPDATILRLKGEAPPGQLGRYGSGKTEIATLASEVAKIEFKTGPIV